MTDELRFVKKHESMKARCPEKAMKHLDFALYRMRGHDGRHPLGAV